MGSNGCNSFGFSVKFVFLKITHQRLPKNKNALTQKLSDQGHNFKASKQRRMFQMRNCT